MPAPTVRRRQEDRTALSDQMMKAAAVKLLVTAGMAGTTLAAIGEEAGYSRGLVTHRFGTKAALLAHVHDAVAADWLARVNRAVDTSTGIAALERVVGVLCQMIADAPNDLRSLYLIRYASIDPSSEYRANVAKTQTAQRRDAERWIKAGQDTGDIDRTRVAADLAELFCATLDGLLYHWLVNPAIPVKALLEQFSREMKWSLASAPPNRPLPEVRERSS